MFNRGSFILRLIGVLLLVGLMIGGGVMAYRAGVAQGIAQAPAVAEARAQGIDVTGPIPADSVFNRAIAGEFDVVLAMYHDQGHIAIKVHNFAESVTATLGIPFIRTSVDHGTAFDIAGRGVADPTSLVAAVGAAVTLATGKLG